MPAGAESITGEWQWKQSQTGWGAVVTASPDSSVLLKIFKDSTFIVTLNNQEKAAGSFTSSRTPGENAITIINFNNNFRVHELRLNKFENIAYLNKDTCILSDYAIADGSSHLLTRKK